MPVAVASALSFLRSPESRCELLGELFIQHVEHPAAEGRELLRLAIRATRRPRAERDAAEYPADCHAGQCRLVIC